MNTLNKRLSVCGVRTPWPDGAALSTVGERTMVLGGYAVDSWPPPPAQSAFTDQTKTFTLDSLPQSKQLTFDSLPQSVRLTVDALPQSLTVVLST